MKKRLFKIIRNELKQMKEQHEADPDSETRFQVGWMAAYENLQDYIEEMEDPMEWILKVMKEMKTASNAAQNFETKRPDDTAKHPDYWNGAIDTLDQLRKAIEKKEF